MERIKNSSYLRRILSANRTRLGGLYYVHVHCIKIITILMFNLLTATSIEKGAMEVEVGRYDSSWCAQLCKRRKKFLNSLRRRSLTIIQAKNVSCVGPFDKAYFTVYSQRWKSLGIAPASVVDPNQDPVEFETFSMIRIRIWIWKKSFQIRDAPDPK
jgi:hypothetical protein